MNIFTLAAKRRRKGMVIILCVCLSVCVRKKLAKLQTLTAQTSYWQTSNYTRIKNNNRLLLKPFGYKVMTIYITHGFCFQTWEDSWAQLQLLHTSKHNYYHIMTIASKALHQIKHNRGSPGYNIEHWLQAFLPIKLLSSSTYLSCARDSHPCKLYVQRFTGFMRTVLSKAETKM